MNNINSGNKILKEKKYHKSLLQIPNRFAIEMIDRGWILRNEIIWHKPNCMPSSADDRFTVDFEKIFFFTKSKKYYFEQQTEPLADATIQRAKCGTWRAKKESKLGKKVLPMNYESFGKAVDKMIEKGCRNKRAVWKIPPTQFKDSHFATYPEKLCQTPILAGCPENGIVLDFFGGAGTTQLVAQKLSRKWLYCDLNPEYCKIAEKRLNQQNLF